MTKPLYRAWVTLEANPPAVAVSDEQTKQQDTQASDSFGFVATQVGLLGSEAVAERTAQELNLANNPDIVRKRATLPRACAARRVSFAADSRSFLQNKDS